MKPQRRVRTPTVLQVEATECGAASLAMVLAYHGRVVPLEQLREECGVSRDGSKASNILKVARTYGMTARGRRKEINQLPDMPLPLIAYWDFAHFVVIEGFGRKGVFINDPGSGPRLVPHDEFDVSYTGVILTFEPTDQFKRGGRRKSLISSLAPRLRGSHSALLFVLLASLSLVIPGLALPSLLRVFVDRVMRPGYHEWTTWVLTAMIATALVRSLLTWLQQFFLARLETRLALTESGKYFWHMLRLPIHFFTQRMPGDISSRVALNDRVAFLLSGQLASAAFNVITVAFYAWLMWLYDPVLTAVVVLLSAVSVVALIVTARVLQENSIKLEQERSKMLGVTVGGLAMMETLKATGREGDFFTRWSGHLARLVNAEQEQDRTVQVLAIVPPLLTALGTASVLALGGWRCMDGALTVGMLIGFQNLMASFNEPLSDLVNQGAAVQQARADMIRLDDVMACPAVIDETPGETSEELGERLVGRIDLVDVTFGYSRLEPPLIAGFNLSVQPGQRVALVGSSGSGKSTLARIISGLHDPWSGEVRFDDRPQREVPRAVRINSLSHVDQEISMFQGTVRDNLTLWDNSVDDLTLLSALRDASVRDVVLARPGGLDTAVAEGGTNWSGGERQRLEIARALVSHPSILVLDEATSALDPLVEKQVDERLRSRGCTCVIVAHRLSTVRDCDEIIVLEGGRVAERGLHDELVARDGPYRRLIEAELQQ